MNAELKIIKVNKKRSRNSQENTGRNKNLKLNPVTVPNSSNDVLKKKKKVAGNGNQDVLVQETSSTTSINNISKKKKKKKKYIFAKNNTASSGTLKKTIEKKSAIFYPKEINQFSSNWKKLLQTMEKTPIDKSSEKKRKSIVTEKSKKILSSPKIFKDEKLRRIKQTTQPKSKKLEIWFDDVDPELLEKNSSKDSVSKITSLKSSSDNERKENVLVKPGPLGGLTNALSMDCEMVGTGDNGQDSILARVSIVNTMGQCVYDKFVKPMEEVTDYRTAVSGVRPIDLEKGEEFTIVQKEVSDLLNGRYLVGHAVYNDLKVLYLSHPKGKTRDTSTYKPFRQAFGGGTPSLKKLADKLLNIKVQEGEHSSIQDAQAAMRLYTTFKKKWESDLKQLRHSTRPTKKSKPPNSPGVMKLSQLKI